MPEVSDGDEVLVTTFKQHLKRLSNTYLFSIFLLLFKEGRESAGRRFVGDVDILNESEKRKWALILHLIRFRDVPALTLCYY